MSASPSSLRNLLARPVVLVFGANLLRAGCGLAVTLVAARVLGPAAFGALSTFVALSILAYGLLGEGFEPGVVRLYAQAMPQGSQAVGQVMGSALAMRVLFLPLLALVLWLVDRFWLADGMGGLALAAGLSGLGASLSMLGLSALQAQGDFRRYALLSPAANALRLLALPVLWLAGALTLDALVGSHVLAFAAAAVAAALVLRPMWRVMRFDRAVLRKLLSFGKWSALATACFVLGAYLQVPWTNRALGSAAAGVYAAAATLLMFIDQFTAALLTTNLARTSRIKSLQGLRTYARHMAPRLLLAAGMLCLLFPLSPVLVRLLFGADFAPAAAVMQALLPGFLATLLSHPLYLVLYALDKPQHYAASGVAGLLTFVALAAWLLPGHGLLGMAWASSIARGLQAMLIVGMVLHCTGRGRARPPPGAPNLPVEP